MRWTFFALIVVHGLIHLLGFTKAFGLYEPPQLIGAISRFWGAVWLVACAAMLATAVLLIMQSRAWWAVGIAAVILSQVVIISSWSDAKLGTIGNVLVLLGIAYGFASEGPFSLAAEYRRAVERRLLQPASANTVIDTDLARLPPPVKNFLLKLDVVGKPRIRHFKATWQGRIRAGANEPWMEFTAEQHNFPGEPSRFFLMRASRSRLPVDVYHAFADESATMRVRLLSLLPMVDARGAEMDRAETVTLFNDICVLAPTELVDPAIRWDPIDERSARGHYTVGENTISAVLQFNDAGELANFVSDDRLAAASDGKHFVRQRWSTPVGAYKTFGWLRAPTRGEGRWHSKEGEYVYLEIELLDHQVNAVTG